MKKKNLSSFKKKYPNVSRVNIKIFCLIFNTGLAAGISRGMSEPASKIITLQRQLKSLSIIDEHKVITDWNSDPDLRAKWEDNFDAYRGFIELGVAGHMKVIARKS